MSEISQEEWDSECKRLGEVIRQHTKAKDYAKDIDEFIRTSKVNKRDAETIAIGVAVKMILRDLANIILARKIKLQRGLDSVIKEIGDKWKSVIRNSIELEVPEERAIELLVGFSLTLDPEMGKLFESILWKGKREENA